ncbi:MAG: hypothetical protein ABJB03_10180 [Rhodoglobus sp.]
MSDDTPTQRFDQPGADAPTERFDSVPPPHDPGASGIEAGDDGEKKSRKLLIILIAVGAAILLGILIVLIVLLTRGNGTPTAAGTSSPSPTASATPTATKSATPSATPTPTPTPTPTQTVAPPPPPPSTEVEITDFSAPSSVLCNKDAPVDPGVSPISFSWSSDNGIAAYFAAGNTNDAEANGMGWTLPPNGNQNDFPSGYTNPTYPCYGASATWTLTVVGTDGSRDTAHVTIQNKGDKQ